MCVWNTMINDLPAWSQDTAQQHLGSACYCQVVWFPPPRPQPLSHCIPHMPPRHTSSEHQSIEQKDYHILKNFFFIWISISIKHAIYWLLQHYFSAQAFNAQTSSKAYTLKTYILATQHFTLIVLIVAQGRCGHQPRVSEVSDDPHTTARVRDQRRALWLREIGPSHSIISQHHT